MAIALLKEMDGLLDISNEDFDAMLTHSHPEIVLDPGDQSHKTLLLDELLAHFGQVVCQAKTNKMTPSALSICTFPFVFGNPSPGTPFQEQILILEATITRRGFTHCMSVLSDEALKAEFAHLVEVILSDCSHDCG